jgi:hypothetical protein
MTPGRPGRLPTRGSHRSGRAGTKPTRPANSNRLPFEVRCSLPSSAKCWRGIRKRNGFEADDQGLGASNHTSGLRRTQAQTGLPCSTSCQLVPRRTGLPCSTSCEFAPRSRRAAQRIPLRLVRDQGRLVTSSGIEPSRKVPPGPFLPRSRIPPSSRPCRCHQAIDNAPEVPPTPHLRPPP